MTDPRQFELYLLRLVPHPLRDDFLTVGVALVESGGEFADVRFTKDWKRVECFAPDLELELLEYLEKTVRGQLKQIHRREDLLRVLEERFGTVFDVGPAKGVLSQNPTSEMELLARDYLAAMQPAERTRSMGRVGIVNRMRDGFADAGLLELLMQDIDMQEFTGEDDPFRVDFGFRVGKALKMFQAMALSASRDPAAALAFRFSKIQTGMRKRNEEALLTAIVQEDALRGKGAAAGIAMLKANEIAVRSIEEIAEIAEETKRELRA